MTEENIIALKRDLSGSEITSLRDEADQLTAAIAAAQANRPAIIQALLDKRDSIKRATATELKNIAASLRSMGHTRQRVANIAKKAAKRGRPPKAKTEVDEGGGSSGGN